MSTGENVVGMDELRARLEGRLDLAARARVDAALARDPELAALSEKLAEVWRETAPGLASGVTSTLRCEDVVGPAHAEARPRPRRRAAAAAAVLLIAGAAWAGWALARRAADARAIVELSVLSPHASTPAGVQDDADLAPRVPELLADWSPVQDGRIRWLDSWDDARAVSSATGRPIFVYGFVESCPICRGFQANEFRDADVLAWIDRTVPLAIDLMAIDAQVSEEMWARRYPLLELQDPTGRILRTFGGTFGDVDMPTEFANAVKDVTVPDWPSMRTLTAELVGARLAERVGDFGAAWSSYEAVARSTALDAWVGDAERGRRRIVRDAQHALDEAVASADTTGGRSAFARAADTFRGTPPGQELEAVRDAWSRMDRFPLLRPHAR